MTLDPRRKPATPQDHYRFEKAKALAAGGHHAQAEALYRELVDEDPGHFRALNNLGALYEAQGRTVEAEWAYRKAIEAEPDSPVLHYNLAHLLQTDRRLEMAEASYRRSLELRPGSFNAWFNLGRILADSGRPGEAAKAFRRAADLDPGHAGAWSCLGEAQYALKRLEESLEAFERAAELAPDEASELFNVGKALEGLGRLEEAADAYRRSLSINPGSETAGENYGRVLHSAGRHEEAAAYFREWTRRDPDHPVPRHMLAAMTGEDVPPRAENDYIRRTFDSFAGDFEATLARLDYRVPGLLEAALGEVAPEENAWNILDAGCGTGLCAPFLRVRARRLVGVDLSRGMLAKAREKGLYDDLVEAELTSWLESTEESFDLVACADTFEYFGDLLPPLRAAAGALCPGGYLLFTVERLHDENAAPGFRLNANGRYAHRDDYVRETLENAGFDVLKLEVITLRREGGLPVAGLLLLARRAEEEA